MGQKVKIRGLLVKVLPNKVLEQSVLQNLKAKFPTQKRNKIKCIS